MTIGRATSTTLATSDAHTPPAATTGGGPTSVDATLSSTTPDVPKGPANLSLGLTVAWGTGLGAGAGALLLRSRGSGWSVVALGGGAWKGAVIGAGIGAALLGLDRVTGGAVKQQVDLISLDRRAQVGFVLTHPTKPWIGPMGMGVASDARAAQMRFFGRAEPLDGAQDAFRHAYASSLFSLRAMRDHGTSPDDAHALSIEAGNAHEADGQDNNDPFSRAMDVANNATGTRLVGDGRATGAEQADAAGFITEAGLERRVLVALGAGALQVVDRTGVEPSARVTKSADLRQR